MTMRIFDRLAPLWRAEARSRLTRNVSTGIALALMFINCAAAQQLSTALDSNAIMGFETPAGWFVTGNNATIPTESPTTTRTQGKSALAVTIPSNLTKLTSMPVASTATALAGVGNSGAIFQVDVMLPLQQGNSNNSGQLQLFVNSPSRGLSKVLVGSVNFSGFRLGTYHTMKFPIPPAIGSALGAAPFNDLTFQFFIGSPGTGQGTYLFDNLRVHSVPLVTATAGTQPPPGYGGSVDFVVFGGTPEAQLFDAAPVQVPDSFHLKLGTVGATTVQLDLGYDGTPSFTCTYDADTTDATGKSYRLQSCSGGIQAGDILGASWAKLTIVAGDPSMKLRAQLAKNPVGDQTGGGIIPAMPTFWGDFDGCIPAVVADKAVPPYTSRSATCASQTAEATQIATAYVKKMQNSDPAPNWIVTPMPEFARRHGDGSPHNNLTGPPPPKDPPFDDEGHLNPGGDWDAYWRVFGNLTYGTSGFDFTTHFDGTADAHVVLWGQDVDALSIQAMADSDVGPTNLGNPKVSGCLHVYLFGAEIQVTGSGNDVNDCTPSNASPSIGFTYHAGDSTNI
ncbi:MAG TPA: hypothetical protein VEU11_09155, partial [Terriglobales bacterium]|nr:hypothetical protein [Terriglobales bacterium]